MTTAVAKSDNHTNDMTQSTPRSNILYTPRVDIFETAEQVVLLADMPGVNPDDVDITLEKHILTITGPAAAPAPEGFSLVHREYRPGTYRRQFSLSDGIDRDGIEANLKNGVLQLVLPKAEPLKARRITVSAAD